MRMDFFNGTVINTLYQKRWQPMKAEEFNLDHALPSNKFYPPRIVKSRSLLRTRILTSKLPQTDHSKKLIVIEAQAGQGKTTLVAQFLEYTGSSYIWYQAGPEDSDPVLLLSSLLVNLSCRLPDFSSPRLTAILEKGSIGHLDMKRCANILLQDLDRFLAKDIYLVFDDIHRIEYNALTNILLDHIIDTSPPKIHFIFVSRQPLELKSKIFRNGSQVSYINTADLALDNREIEDLFNTVLHKKISRADAARIRDMTNGWIMGIILAGHPVSGEYKFWMKTSEDATSARDSKGHMLDYFQEEIFDQIPKDLHISFLQIAMLQEIPAELAADLTGVDNLSIILSGFSRANFFIYPLDDKYRVFRFHHFFQEFLQERARSHLAAGEISRIYRHEARYYLDRDQTEKALACYKNGEDYDAMETILRERGMNLIARNKTITILTLLQSIPEKTLCSHSWLTFYTGLLQIDVTPQRSIRFFNSARQHFTETGEETGELLALSQTIYFYFAISGQHSAGSELLQRTTTLFEKLKSSLPVPVIITAARNLASGYCFFNGDLEKARYFANMASSLASSYDSRNFIASSRFVQGYIELRSGNLARYLREAEICFTLFNDPLVAESNKLTMRTMSLCFLSMTGDHLNYSRRRDILQKNINKKIIEQTVAAPYLFIWDSSNLFSKGRTVRALALLTKALSITSSALTDHMRSQILQWQAFGYTLTGRTEKALILLSESAKLRDSAGSPFCTALYYIIAGTVYTRLKMFDKADETLKKGMGIAQSISSTYLIICAFMNRSYCKYECNNREAAVDDLEAGLSLMKISGYDHFWSWEPVMMTRLLNFAVARDIEKNFARSLAHKRLGITFSGKGKLIPLLTFTLLDSFSIGLGDKILFQAKDLTPFQRELLGLLITAKGQRIPQDRIQLELWPDSSPENARKSFDTLLARLRKLLKPRLPVNIKNYLFMQKGILCLANYKIDALEFTEAARIGLSHNKNGDQLQAHNAFQRAFSAYRGVMPEDIFRSEQVLAYNDQLAHLFVEFSSIWATNMTENGETREAITLIERVLQINLLEENLVRLLYQLHSRNNSPLKARKTLESYKKALIKAEYTEEEIEEFIKSITSA